MSGPAQDRFRRAKAVVLEAARTPDDVPTAWVDVVAEEHLRPEVGLPALVSGQAVAVFRTFAGELYAVSNYDPASGASVIARGIVGTRGDVPVVASPMYKHVFDLRTGRCLDDESKSLQTYEVRVRAGVVQVRETQKPTVQGNGRA